MKTTGKMKKIQTHLDILYEQNKLMILVAKMPIENHLVREISLLPSRNKMIKFY